MTLDDASPLSRLVATFAAGEEGAVQLGPATWTFPFEVDHGPQRVFISARGTQLLVYATRPEPVPADRHDEVVMVLGDLNPLLTVAWLECQRETGLVSARTAVEAQGVTVAPTLLDNMVGVAVAVLDRFLPALDAVAAGELDARDLRDAPPADDGVDHLDLDQATTQEIREFFERAAGG